MADIENPSSTNPILTIAIPTFNRKDSLKQTIDSVLAQPHPLVEIIVSDNASTDGTELLMQDYVQKYPEMKYYRNAENLGPDGNFLNCYRNASGKYVLLLSDDDLLLPNALFSIIEALQGDPVFVHLNSCMRTLSDVKPFSAPRLPEGELYETTSKDDALQIMGIFVTFLSSLVVKKELVDAIPNKERFLNTSFIQSHISLETMRTEGTYAIVNRCCIAEMPNDHVSYDLYEVWGKQFRQLLFTTASNCGFQDATIDTVFRKSVSTTILAFMSQFRPCESKWDTQAMFDALKGYSYLKPIYWLAIKLPQRLSRSFSSKVSRVLVRQ